VKKVKKVTVMSLSTGEYETVRGTSRNSYIYNYRNLLNSSVLLGTGNVTIYI